MGLPARRRFPNRRVYFNALVEPGTQFATVFGWVTLTRLVIVKLALPVSWIAGRRFHFTRIRAVAPLVTYDGIVQLYVPALAPVVSAVLVISSHGPPG